MIASQHIVPHALQLMLARKGQVDMQQDASGAWHLAHGVEVAGVAADAFTPGGEFAAALRCCGVADVDGGLVKLKGDAGDGATHFGFLCRGHAGEVLGGGDERRHQDTFFR